MPFKVPLPKDRSDLGEEWESGFHVKTFGTPAPSRESLADNEVETADPVSIRRPLTHRQREDMPAKFAAMLMDYYTSELNNPNILNPIRDGIPQCKAHPFKSGKQFGCWYACKEHLLPVTKDHTLYDVFMWAQGLIRHAYKDARRSNKWSGWQADIR